MQTDLACASAQNKAPARGAGSLESTVQMDTLAPGAPRHDHTSSISFVGGARSIRARLVSTSSRPTSPPAETSPANDGSAPQTSRRQHASARGPRRATRVSARSSRERR